MRIVAPPGYAGSFRTDEMARAVYSEGAGIARVWPRAIAVPSSPADVRALVVWAHGEGVPLIPRGSGSGMAGGAVGDGVVVDLSRLRRLDPVDREARSVRAAAGILRGELDRAAHDAGLRFPVDPSSGEFCTIGGMAATNAAGAHTVRHGATRRWVRAVRCVFDDGFEADVRRGTPAPTEAPSVRRFVSDARDRLIAGERAAPSVHAGVRKESSGYATAAYAESGELLDLLIGSEGTLALFTEIEVMLEPVPPATASMLAAFGLLDDAVRAVGGVRQAGAAACELLDRTFLDVAASGGAALPVPPASDAVLLIEMEGSAAVVEELARATERHLRECGAIMVTLALDPPTERRLWDLRHAVSPILSRLDPSIKSMQFVEDGAVPPERLADYVRGVRSALARRGVPGVIFGHAADAHIHVNPLIDVQRPDWRACVAAIFDDVVALTASLGGTLTGEHGDGRLRTPALSRVWSAAACRQFALVKHAFDPTGILNPGVKVMDAHRQEPMNVKYDPALPPLPSPATAILQRIEHGRAYASFRLALLDGATAS